MKKIYLIDLTFFRHTQLPKMDIKNKVKFYKNYNRVMLCAYTTTAWQICSLKCYAPCSHDRISWGREQVKFGYSEKATKFEKIFHIKFDIKVRTFWETHKIWKNLPYGFDKSADLLSKRQNHKEYFFKSLYVYLKKSQLY